MPGPGPGQLQGKGSGLIHIAPDDAETPIPTEVKDPYLCEVEALEKAALDGAPLIDGWLFDESPESLAARALETGPAVVAVTDHALGRVEIFEYLLLEARLDQHRFPRVAASADVVHGLALQPPHHPGYVPAVVEGSHGPPSLGVRSAASRAP